MIHWSTQQNEMKQARTRQQTSSFRSAMIDCSGSSVHQGVSAQSNDVLLIYTDQWRPLRCEAFFLLFYPVSAPWCAAFVFAGFCFSFRLRIPNLLVSVHDQSTDDILFSFPRHRKAKRLTWRAMNWNLRFSAPSRYLFEYVADRYRWGFSRSLSLPLSFLAELVCFSRLFVASGDIWQTTGTYLSFARYEKPPFRRARSFQR